MLAKMDSSGTTSYTWDFENRLTSVVLPSAGGTVAFKYDPFGRRVQKPSGGSTTSYIYDGSALIEELDSSGGLTARYTHGSAVDEPLAQERGGAGYDYLHDGLGSITSLSDSHKNPTNTYSYDSFGNTTASATGVANPFRYTGREFDTETGLYYYRARYYDPSVGRFIDEDPIGLGGGTNGYRYVGNRATTLTDPLGLANYLLLVGDAGLVGHNVGRGFDLAAQTYSDQLPANGDTATIVHVSSVQDLATALVSHGDIDGGVAYFGHAGALDYGGGNIVPALFLGENPGGGTNLTFQNISALSGRKLGSKANFSIYACNAASFGRRSIAQALANQLRHGVYVYNVGMFFSGNPNATHSARGSRGLSSLPVYMLPEGGGNPTKFTPQ